MLVVWFCLLALAVAMHSSLKYDKQCTIKERAFTGVRLLHERSMTLPPLSFAKHTVVLECGLGRELYRVSLPWNETVFDRNIEAPNKLLRFVRQATYSDRTQLRYIPGTLVGAIYESHDNGTEWTAVSPLVADSWDIAYESDEDKEEETATARIMTSLLRSPDVLEKTYPHESDWETKIPVSSVKAEPSA